ncbi:hypothetical protein B0J11DRAFT_318649 [Dendryphion nanum]|uniref:Tail specific protease domain-containing protein n=1 Tax=Dendryphion nanum TaxID=256645 RepID=A0A9P9IKC2_9PLEO|nr:hypothetical protein B0J11DRAFT_318649 [Dendryphion nanum]
MLFSTAFAAICFASAAYGRSVQHQPVRRQQPSPTAGAPAPQQTACGDLTSLVDDGYTLFDAKFAFDCLTSVPFNPAVATRFVQYFNETWQFQSTLSYLKNPPQGYQQPAVDVVAELGEIQQRINSGFYSNQYAFEADFHLVAHAMHDAHVVVRAGALAAFQFGSSYEIVSVSEDGKKPPKIYFTADVIGLGNKTTKPSAIKTINGVPAVEFLTKFARDNAYGFVEPHAEWNSLMSSPVLDIQGDIPVFAGKASLYPGENVTFAYEDGSEPIQDTWTAYYTEPANATGPLTTGGDFYNYFVLGRLPASFNGTFSDSSNETSGGAVRKEAPGNWFNTSFEAYPAKPNVVQSQLGRFYPGWVTGYFFKDAELGVLSLPSFDSIPDATGNYSKTVEQFITKATDNNVSRIVIDLQQNSGGAILLAFTTFKSFFPDVNPFAGSRRASFPLANAIGYTISEYWEDLDEADEGYREEKYNAAANEWVITNRINAETGENFTWWGEYAGPVTANGANFSLPEQYNLSNIVFDRAAFDEWYPVMYFPNEKSKWPRTERPFKPEQIVLLTDGLCSSSCALFVEMMAQTGVRTVVAGGSPSSGPMQAVSGNRGASVYSTSALDSDIAFSREETQYEEDFVLLPEVRESGIYVEAASVNLRDQVRPNSSLPLQFSYEAADCRIWYTLKNVYNFTQLWHDVSTAAFVDPSLCVEGSTGFSKKNGTTSKPPPKVETQRLVLSQNNTVIEKVQHDYDPKGGLQNDEVEAQRSRQFAPCDSQDKCEKGFSPKVYLSTSCTQICICRPVCSTFKPCPAVTSSGGCNPDTSELKPFGNKQTSKGLPQGGQDVCAPTAPEVEKVCARAKRATRPKPPPPPPRKPTRPPRGK